MDVSFLRKLLFWLLVITFVYNLVAFFIAPAIGALLAVLVTGVAGVIAYVFAWRRD